MRRGVGGRIGVGERGWRDWVGGKEEEGASSLVPRVVRRSAFEVGGVAGVVSLCEGGNRGILRSVLEEEEEAGEGPNPWLSPLPSAPRGEVSPSHRHRTIHRRRTTVEALVLLPRLAFPGRESRWLAAEVSNVRWRNWEWRDVI